MNSSIKFPYYPSDKEAAMRSKFDFAFPVGAFGNSSSWCPSRGIVLQRQSDLGARRMVILRRCADGVFVRSKTPPNTAKTMFCDFLRKYPLCTSPQAGDIPALTSGAGSALFRLASNRVIKLKRCGVGDMGFVDQQLRANCSENIHDDHFEVASYNYSGLMSVDSAAVELEMALTLQDAGLTHAYTPIGMVIAPSLQHVETYTGPDHPVAAVLMEVHSDLRLDELVYMCMTPVLSELFRSKILSYDSSYPQWGFFDAHGIPLFATRASWKNISERLFYLGVSAGSAYHRCHEIGFLRGFGSCWFGNEVVHPDGDISMVDFDGGAILQNSYAESLRETLQFREIAQYSATALLMLNTFRPTALQLFGVDFVRGITAGYVGDYQKIPQYLLDSILDDYLATQQDLWDGMGFSSSDDTPLPTLSPLEMNSSNPLIEQLHRLFDQPCQANGSSAIATMG